MNQLAYCYKENSLLNAYNKPNGKEQKFKVSTGYKYLNSGSDNSKSGIQELVYKYEY